MSAKERYDRAVVLTKLSKATVTLGSLPVVAIATGETETDTFGYGSRVKFQHDL
jgi:hypothetical protein